MSVLNHTRLPNTCGVYVYVFVGVVSGYVHTHAYGGQKSAFSASLNPFSLLVFEKGDLMNMELIGWLD